MSRLSHQGFTLMELLIALAMFALLSAMAFGGLNSMLKTEQQLESHSQQFKQLQRALYILGEDLNQLAGRAIRDQYGDRQPPLQSQEVGQLLLEFTRAGWANPARQPRSTLQRVGYGVEEGVLSRYSWRVLDRGYASEPDKAELLHEVEEIRFRFLDQEGAWLEGWPPIEQSTTGEGSRSTPLPRAVEVTVTVARYGELRRLIRTVGVTW
ncbi:MAG: type II secretion system minor pseudopilin GspJ [Gammaproteobacteria bacterium]|nr:type II secretion system minor pseudopilin GspJ [Gammaproteobacteria bacterium]